MHYEKLEQYLSQFKSFSPEESRILRETSQLQFLNKGDYLLHQGDICRKIAFIYEGILRVCYFDGENEFTGYFLKEAQFATHLESFHERVPSDKSIQAVTDCTLLVLTRPQMQKLEQLIPQWKWLVAKVSEKLLSEKLYNRSPLVNQDARTRYENFLKEQGDIALRVPLTYIASYLGITVQSLSRLRRQLAES